MKRDSDWLKYTLVFFTLLVALAVVGCGPGDDEKSVRIASGPVEGYYHRVLYANLKDIQQKHFNARSRGALGPRVAIELSPTAGSVANLEFLDQRTAQIAIVQGDVAVRAREFCEEPVYTIARLFYEHILVISLTNDPEPQKRKLNDCGLKRVFVGSQGSGTAITADALLSVSRLSSQGIDIKHNPNIGWALERTIPPKPSMRPQTDDEGISPGETAVVVVLHAKHPLMRDFFDGRFDGFDRSGDEPISLRNEPGVKELYQRLGLGDDPETGEGFGLVFYELGSEQLNSIERLHKGYNVVPVKIVLANKTQVEYRTLVTPALALARSALSKHVASTFAAAVYDIIGAGHAPGDDPNAPLQSDDTAFFRRVGIPSEDQERWPVPFHPGGLAEYIRQHPRAKASGSYAWMSTLFVVLSVLLVAVNMYVFAPTAMMESFLRLHSRGVRGVRRTMNAMSNWKIVIALMSLGFLFWLGAFCVRTIEVRGAEAFRYESPFQDMTLQQVFMWLLTLITSGIENGVYPVQLHSQVIVIMLHVLVVVGVPAYVVIMIWQTVSRIITARTGMPSRLFVDHVVIVGWEPQAQDLIADILHRNSLARFVIVADISHNPMATCQLPANRVAFIHGSPVELKTMKDARMDVARCIVVLEHTENHERQLAHCPGLSVAFCRKFRAFCQQEGVKSYPRVIVKGSHERHAPLLEALGLPTVRSKLAHDRFVPILFEQGAGVFRFLSESWSMINSESAEENSSGIVAMQVPRDQFWSASKHLGIAWDKDNFGRNPLERFFTLANTADLLARYRELQRVLASRSFLLVGISMKCRFPGANEAQRYVHVISPMEADVTENPGVDVQIQELCLYCVDIME